MMEGDPLGSTTASPANPAAGFGGRRYGAKMQERSSYLPNQTTKRRPPWERENEREEQQQKSPTHINPHTWLLLVGVLLLPRDIPVARARVPVSVL